MWYLLSLVVVRKTKFKSILLRPKTKQTILSWHSGSKYNKLAIKNPQKLILKKLGNGITTTNNFIDLNSFSNAMFYLSSLLKLK